jgi:hypothetical protein
MILSFFFWLLDGDKQNVADAITTLILAFAGLAPSAILVAAGVQQER